MKPTVDASEIPWPTTVLDRAKTRTVNNGMNTLPTSTGDRRCFFFSNALFPALGVFFGLNS